MGYFRWPNRFEWNYIYTIFFISFATYVHEKGIISNQVVSSWFLATVLVVSLMSFFSMLITLNELASIPDEGDLTDLQELD